MTLKGSGETKHRGRRRDGTNHFTAVWCVAISPIYAFLLFHPPPIVLPDIFKNLPPLLSLSSLSSFFNVLHDTFPRWMREKFERERGGKAQRVGVEKENPGRSYRVVGLCLIKPGNETSMIRFGGRAVGRPLGWVFSRAFRRANRVSTANRIESNRKEPRRH